MTNPVDRRMPIARYRSEFGNLNFIALVTFKVTRPHAHRRILLVDWLFHVVWCPAGHVFEQPNAADAFVGAKIEPVMRSFGNAEQIARLDGHAEYRLSLIHI